MTTQTPSNPAEKKTSTWKYIWNHKLVFFLLFLLIVGAGWAGVKILTLKRGFNKEKTAITNKFAEETARVFSWAVRGEMLRENKDQVNQYFLNLVKEPGFKKIQLVDVNNSTIIISTDKKEEGSAVSDTSILNANFARQISTEGLIRTITPVMGLNSRMAVLVIDREIPKNN
jgi:hypothetical protein